jgi:hypothetical protein
MNNNILTAKARAEMLNIRNKYTSRTIYKIKTAMSGVEELGIRRGVEWILKTI